jgi:hypothetical protein
MKIKVELKSGHTKTYDSVDTPHTLLVEIGQSGELLILHSSPNMLVPSIIGAVAPREWVSYLVVPK